MPLPGLSRLPGVRARMLHDVRLCARRDGASVRAPSERAADSTGGRGRRRRKAGRRTRPHDRVVISGRGRFNRRLMAATLEREIKLQVRRRGRGARGGADGRPGAAQGRRLQEDCLLDTPDGRLRQRRSVLRVRMESGRTFLTFKGPVQPSPMKLREELETIVSDGPLLVRMLEELGFHVWFRYREVPRGIRRSTMSSSRSTRRRSARSSRSKAAIRASAR